MTTMLPKTPQPSQEVFRLLDLPAELRLQIYNFALPQKVRVKPVGSYAWKVTEYRDALALLRTCHQICKEARPLLFSNSRFHIEIYDEVNARHFRAWIDRARDELVSRMKRFEIGIGAGASVAGVGAPSTEFGRTIVMIEVRAEGAGPVVTCSEMHARLLRCPTTVAFFQSKWNSIFEQHHAIFGTSKRREWSGCFCAADVKIMVGAIYERTWLEAALMGD